MAPYPRARSDTGTSNETSIVPQHTQQRRSMFASPVSTSSSQHYAPGSVPATVTSLDAARNDHRMPQREWSLFETILLEGEEHPLRRTASSADIGRNFYPPGSTRTELSTPGSVPEGVATPDPGACDGSTSEITPNGWRQRVRRTSHTPNQANGERSSYFYRIPSTSVADSDDTVQPLAPTPGRERSSTIASRNRMVNDDPQDISLDSDATPRAALFGSLANSYENYIDSQSDTDESDSELSSYITSSAPHALPSSSTASTTFPLFQSRFSWLPTLTTLQRDILKCSIAYFIGSLFTFNSTLSKLVADIGM